MAITFKNRGIYTTAIILTAILTFLICTFGNLLIHSQDKHVKDFYTDFITSDLIILSKENTQTAPFIIPDFSLPKNIPGIDAYPSLETFLVNNKKIVSFTPYTFTPATLINENKGKLLIWLKVIDEQSFFDVFPRINITHPDDSPLDSIRGIALPTSLATHTGDLFNISLTQGDYLLITDEKVRISSVRETTFSGTVSYNGYTSLFSTTGYCTVKSYPWQGDNIPTENEPEKKIISLFPDKDTFHRNFITSESPIQKKELHDSYFFEFFNVKKESYKKNNSYTPKWQYIALSVKQKEKIENIKKSLNNQFYINDQNVKALSWKDTAGPVLTTVVTYRVFLYCITLLMLLLLFIITFLNIKACVKSLQINEEKNYQENSVSLLQKEILSLNIKTIISSAAGILTGVLMVVVINAAALSPGKDYMSLILAGGNTLCITISIAPVFISILLSLIFTVSVNIYPFTQLSRLRDYFKKHTYNNKRL